MVNLFSRPAVSETHGLTAALLALLEHADRSVLRGLLERAGLPPPNADLEKLQVTLAEEGTGSLAAPGFRLLLTATPPGQPPRFPPLPEGPGGALAITQAGQAPTGVAGLSWEQVDRWLATLEAESDPNSRTGFLLRQFRAFLPEVGVAYFAGFDPSLLRAAPSAHAELTRFYQQAGQFLDLLTPALGALREGLAPARQAGPPELLAGYCYRDLAGPGLGAAAFLRTALHLPDQELQLALWLLPGAGGEAHSRLRELLVSDRPFLARLADLQPAGLLWLWAPSGEHRLSLASLQPEQVAHLPWAQYQAGVQQSLPLTELEGHGLVDRTVAAAAGLLDRLAPALAPVLH